MNLNEVVNDLKRINTVELELDHLIVLTKLSELQWYSEITVHVDMQRCPIATTTT